MGSAGLVWFDMASSLVGKKKKNRHLREVGF